MCGIFSLLNFKKKKLNLPKIIQDFYNLKNRGPDFSSFQTYNDSVLIGFHRLAIIDPTFKSNQPFVIESERHTIVFICNGEIYNHKEIRSAYKLTDSKSDCMIIPEIYNYLLETNNTDLFPQFIKNDVKGEFAFVLFEFDNLKNLRKVVVARDEIGIRPLYYNLYELDSSATSDDMIVFSSELKGLMTLANTKIVEFPPGHIKTYSFSGLGDVSVTDYDFSSVYDTKISMMKISAYKSMIQNSVLASIRRRLEADKPMAFLLSGGVDSSLVAAISARILGKQIRTFCCGMEDGTDMQFARQVAAHIGSNHTEVFFTKEEALAAIPEVIKTVETWDTTTIRASVGQYLVSKYISTKTDCKVVMVGEGPDEVCSSYLFNWYAPNGDALHQAAKDYVKNIHYYDVKRADRCVAHWGLEARVPFLDPEFIKTYWTIPPAERMPTYENMEKWWLRDAFSGTKLLPNAVLWRKKEAFSDGISGEKSWFQIIQEWVDPQVSVEDLEQATTKFPYCTPKTKEAYYYREQFCSIFGMNRQEIIPGYWQPKWSADKKDVLTYMDPSARVLGIY